MGARVRNTDSQLPCAAHGPRGHELCREDHQCMASRTLARWSCGNPFIERLPQDREHMACALRELIQQAHAMVGPRHLAWPRHLAATDQSRIRDGMMRGATRSRGDQRCAVAGEAGNAVEERGLNGLGEGHRWQDGGQPPCGHRLTRSRRSQEEDIMGRTPAYASVSPRLKNLEGEPIWHQQHTHCTGSHIPLYLFSPTM